MHSPREQPREEQASMAKHPPFDAVPALSNGVWVREKAMGANVAKAKEGKTRSAACRRHVTVSTVSNILYS